VSDRSPQATDGSIVSIEAYRAGPLGPYLAAKRMRDLSHAPDALPAEGSQQLLFAPWLLQDIADYRYALQRWFACVAVGGHLVVTVPHAFLHDRRAQLPSPWRAMQRRLYTPASLLAEVEEALTPNSYRVRWLGDEDAGYDYALERDAPPVGRQDIALVVERIDPPAWTLVDTHAPAESAPDAIFGPIRTRIEPATTRSPVRSILLLKLDHLGDFVMSVPAIRAVRAHFPEAHITLVVGQWNEALAAELQIADKVTPFDFFTRNPGEDGYLDPATRAEAFAALINDHYDLAIDLRTFADTRFLLAGLDAGHRAGIGTRAVFPFLDIALPLDSDAERLGHAEVVPLQAAQFKHGDLCARETNSIRCRSDRLPQPRFAIVWGPYRRLEIGDYILRPAIDINTAQGGMLAFDVVVDQRECASGTFDVWSADLEFRVEQPGAFEFRLWTVDGHPLPDFDFRGCRLFRKGVPAELHESESQLLLIELTVLRLAVPAKGGAG